MTESSPITNSTNPQPVHSVPLLYLVHRETLSSVISSQVITPLEKLQPATSVTLGLMTPIGQLWRSKHRPALQKIEHRCGHTGIRLGWLPSPPTRLSWMWSDAFVLRRWIRRHFPDDQPLIVRCRNATTTSIALDALQGYRNARVIYDCRGAEVTEMMQTLGLEATPENEWPAPAKTTIKQIRAAEERAVHEAAGVTCVSHAMVDSLSQTYPQIPREKFFVVPCCPDIDAFTRVVNDREVVRRELGLHDKYVVSYCGSLAWYQFPEASIQVFRLIKSLRADAHFFAITTQPDQMRLLLENAGFSAADYTIRSVPAQDVPRLLIASDLGLMIRDDSLTNRVASPIKFGEYMAAGIPVVISPRLGDCSESVRRERLGIEVDLTLDDGKTIASLRSFVAMPSSEQSEIRERCRDFANRHLSWSVVLPQLTEWFGRIAAPHGSST